MTTAIAAWGNSAAVRIPKSILNILSLRQGDQVEMRVNERGNIEISPVADTHRRISPVQGVTFDSLFDSYEGDRYDASDAWADEDLMGAEAGVWS